MDHFNSLGNNCLPDQGEKQKEFLKIGGEYLVILLINKLILEEIKLRYHLKLWDHYFARGKTSSLPNMVAAISLRWDENRNRGKDEATKSRGELGAANCPG